MLIYLSKKEKVAIHNAIVCQRAYLKSLGELNAIQKTRLETYESIIEKMKKEGE